MHTTFGLHLTNLIKINLVGVLIESITQTQIILSFLNFGIPTMTVTQTRANLVSRILETFAVTQQVLLIITIDRL